MASSEAEVRQAQMQLQQGCPCHKLVDVQSEVACAGNCRDTVHRGARPCVHPWIKQVHTQLARGGMIGCRRPVQ